MGLALSDISWNAFRGDLVEPIEVAHAVFEQEPLVLPVKDERIDLTALWQLSDPLYLAPTHQRYFGPMMSFDASVRNDIVPTYQIARDVNRADDQGRLKKDKDAQVPYDDVVSSAPGNASDQVI